MTTTSTLRKGHVFQDLGRAAKALGLRMGYRMRGGGWIEPPRGRRCISGWPTLGVTLIRRGLLEEVIDTDGGGWRVTDLGHYAVGLQAQHPTKAVHVRLGTNLDGRRVVLTSIQPRHFWGRQ